ncbi:glycoside hydrolase superfamily [Aspergillus avenaceus]|uniref:Probable beta-glucosidase btgE n=1 Tax=Aspergillus avenaceus TaxID=36643 RepID=A0A5N6TUD0_ASPAV|nr:glycoside hydrolase superfamily [Aspergillus avenaceus]
MRGAFLAAAAAVAGTAVADVAHMRHGHEALHQRRAYQPEPVSSEESCGCRTEVVTYYGPPTLVPINTPAPQPTTSSSQVPAPSVPGVPGTSDVPAPSAPSSTATTATTEDITTLHSTSTATVTVVTSPGVDATGVETPSGGIPNTPEASVPAETPSGGIPNTPEASVPAETPSGGIPNTPAVPVTSTTPEATTPEAVLPTPAVTTFSSTGVYTFPATTVTVRDTTTVCGATTTDLPSGTQTYGGVVTVVETATTVTCPVATVEPSGSTVTSKIYTTTYECPSAGTYTIVPPTTTYVPTSTVVVYPTPHTITPGTYTAPEQVVTVTRTDTTYVCPFTGNDEPTSYPVAPSTSAVPATTTAVATTAVPTSVAPSSSATSSSSTAVPTGVSGTQMGMTYSPYTNEGGCQSKDEIQKHIALIKQKGFTHVRVYSTDCNGLEYVGEAAKQNGLKLIIGVFISSTGISGAQEQVTAISKWAQWDLVTLIVVGNEAIQNGYTDASSLAGFIASAKGSFQAAGYSGQITTTEPINVWQQSGSALCSAVDILGANLHPFFNADVTADQAGTFVKNQVADLKKVCNKDVINLETGWPSQGSANGKAVPGSAEQATAIKSLVQEVGTLSVFFSYANDLWKDAGEFNVERYWGCIEQF